MRHIKAIGVALIAILVVGGTGATGAFADELTSESSPVVMTGGSDPGSTDQFLTTAGSVQCTAPGYRATAVTPTTSVTAEPTYSGCTTAGVPSEIEMNGCVYWLHIVGGTSTSGDVDLICPAGKEATITVRHWGGTTAVCTIHVKPQSDIFGTVTYTNIGAGSTREITVRASLTGIDYTHTSGSGLAKCTGGSAINGSLNAKAVVTGEQDLIGAHVGVFLSNI